MAGDRQAAGANATVYFLLHFIADSALKNRKALMQRGLAVIYFFTALENSILFYPDFHRRNCCI